jgi:hypothetical protein
MKYIFTILLLVFTVDLFGCSCTPPNVKEAYKKSDAAFVAKIIDVEIFIDDDFIINDKETQEGEIWLGMNGYLIEVKETFKGKYRSKTFWILSNRMSCGKSLDVGTTYLIYSNKHEKIKSFSSRNFASLITGYCFGTKNTRTRQAKLDLKYLKN